MRRRTVLAAAAAALHPTALSAQDRWPTRPIRLVVPFSPGGTTDLVGRLIAPSMGAALGQQIIVDNKAGAGGILGTDAVAKAKDGHTLGVGTVSTHAIGPALLRHPPYAPAADFAAIAVLGTTSLAIFVHPSIGATLAALCERARAEPGQLNFGSPGTGSLGHIAGLWFNRLAGVVLAHVPYRGSGLALQDLLAGRIHVLFENIPTALSQVTAGTVNALAVTSTSRSRALPGVPTTVEVGLADFQIESWTMLFAPAGTSPATVARINQAANGALDDAAVRTRLSEASVDSRQGTPDDASRFLASEIAKWLPLAKGSGAVVD